MKIAFNCIYFGEKAGCAKHMTNLFKQLQQTETSNEYYVFLNENMYDFFKFYKDNFHKVHIGKAGNRPASAILYRQTILPLKMKRMGINLYVDTVNPLVFLKTTKTIAIIRDMGECFVKGKYDGLRMFYRTKIMLPMTARFADRILTISESTRSDILKILNVDPEKVRVIYHGRDEDMCKLTSGNCWSELKAKYGIPESKYLLHVGRLDPVGKNINRLIEAFGILKKEKKIEHKLLLIGKEWRRTDMIYEAIERHQLVDEIVFSGYVERDDLAKFYSISDALIFPSLYEGFGHPVIEAMSCQCPVVCSNVSSLPEVAGGAAVLFDPYDPRDMAEKTYEVLTNKTLWRQMVQNGLCNVKRFSWKKNANEYLLFFEEIVNGSKQKKGLGVWSRLRRLGNGWVSGVKRL
ncbi:MAG: glycosyltransferase family 4 protein [Anaerohalosphaera sp.]|nr:glycosyltransferase family 4 protein [Anaerohalosphaera sp.]